MDTNNLQVIVAGLLETGLTQQELADLVPCSQATIAAYSNGTRGARPTYLIAKRLFRLHSDRCKQGKKSSAVKPPS